LPDSKAFLGELQAEPLSEYRYSIELFSYQDSATQCRPPESWLSKRLENHLVDLHLIRHELCPLAAGDAPGPIMEDLAQGLKKMHARLILKRKPRFDSLTLKVGSVDKGFVEISRSSLIFQKNQNEILFRPEATQWLHQGDRIEVSYVADPEDVAPTHSSN